MAHPTILKYINEGSNAAKQSKREKSQNCKQYNTMYTIHNVCIKKMIKKYAVFTLNLNLPDW